ncbi:PIF1-like helicase domain-containing protein [Hirsutella rhossiliensis]|uniref:ATP-dependent DNA helicase n=1 Tax=Hirsutella rhossiliensis TaxID=111463 RepID=A0A9P8SEP8_9HYPO|nr:PIF1-like helicase domain-containing protein [Hirsutella rhossiliensis]KAH0959911.1 PIF1-like helicase domain-containing protein [Hirsutella rhossiliensis]
MALSRQLLRDNAHIAAYHFHKRHTLFRTIVLKQKFNLTDSWGRYEWQGRGSSHHHGLYWLSGHLDLDPDNDQSPDAAALQSRLRHIKYLVVDEKSMLGLEQLARIDSRLRQAFPQRNLEFFGGVSVLLVGDFFQLPPVRQKPLYSTSTCLSSSERRGQVAYRLFNRTVFLTTVQRQAGDD